MKRVLCNGASRLNILAGIKPIKNLQIYIYYNTLNMEALQNFINGFVHSAKKAKIGGLSNKGSFVGGCNQHIMEADLNDQNIESINKRRNSNPGFSMPNIK